MRRGQFPTGSLDATHEARILGVPWFRATPGSTELPAIHGVFFQGPGICRKNGVSMEHVCFSQGLTSYQQKREQVLAVVVSLLREA